MKNVIEQQFLRRLIHKLLIRETASGLSQAFIGKILIGRPRMARAIGVVLTFTAFAQAQSAASGQAQTNSVPTSPSQQGVSMSKHAKGTFDVTVTPRQPDSTEAETAKLGRMSLDKQFHGDLEGTSAGEMLGAMTEVKGSAGYVAMERVNATLQGHHGTFVLQHSGTMSHGDFHLSVTVVPDSATGDLLGLAGSMTIRIEEGKHFYDFEYTLPATK
jgi:hypothetical protein